MKITTKKPSTQCSLGDFLSVCLCIYVSGEEEGRRKGKRKRTEMSFFKIWYGGVLSSLRSAF